VKYPLAGFGLLWTAMLLGGCPAESFLNKVPATQQEINLIVKDTALTPQDQRIQLEALGLSDSTINALLSGQQLGNQFGGDPRTAYNKVAGAEFTQLTPDEVQIYGRQASAADPNHQLSVNLTDSEAQAVVDFFHDFNISSKDALAAWLDTPGNTPPSTIPTGVLRALFVDFDPKLVLPNLP
jgi:hypothetical protein